MTILINIMAIVLDSGCAVETVEGIGGEEVEVGGGGGGCSEIGVGVVIVIGGGGGCVVIIVIAVACGQQQPILPTML